MEASGGLAKRGERSVCLVKHSRKYLSCEISPQGSQLPLLSGVTLKQLLAC